MPCVTCCTKHSISISLIFKTALYNRCHYCPHFTVKDAESQRCYLRRDFPGGLVVKNLPSNAEDAGLIPGLGTKIPHAIGQLSPCAATTEPA